MEDEDPIPLSALQHHLFCPRQCALIHVERQWAENASTAEGRVLHERVDQPGRSHRDRVRTVRSLPLRCRRLNLIGVADVVEFQPPDHRPYPVEFKRGRPKAHRADEVQLCAQALCLEEMFGQPVMEGALFYGEKRRRMAVAFDTELRTLTERVAADVRAMIDQGRTPPPVHEPSRCRQCSLIDLCQPRRLAAPPSVADWLRRHLRD
ncbi:CRISPR-associated protein Cas4 [Nitrospirillum pindoramense]|uniref:CRISPR-associated exonuclease Cas4 n=1 Tax=Nitrospirillum amazonense TaxID=28077 RepID=A0A560HH71_9PROT|nr:CRISPR-associated protein Cas4 [Nitrospirillum amazonense]TWB45807.1 CRISPR-associated Cas4 family exonuclease [Nitrospirillum amazonense]